MNETLTKKLYDKYPDIFQEHDKPMSQTSMCFGFQCSDGWFDLIDTLCYSIRNHLESKKNNRDYHIKAVAEGNKYYKDKPIPDEVEPLKCTTCKEKLGGLRFYTEGGDDYTEGLISMAEAMSYHICEFCGNKGECNDENWLITLCDPCRAKRDLERSGGV